jgi:hypothetical protein
VAGADVDTFEIPVAGGDCLDVFVQLNGASATLNGPPRAGLLPLDPAPHRSFEFTAAGTVTITLRSQGGAGGTYRLVVR